MNKRIRKKLAKRDGYRTYRGFRKIRWRDVEAAIWVDDGVARLLRRNFSKRMHLFDLLVAAEPPAGK